MTPERDQSFRLHLLNKIGGLPVYKTQFRILHCFYIFGCQQEKYYRKDKHNAVGKKEIQFPFKFFYHGRPFDEKHIRIPTDKGCLCRVQKGKGQRKVPAWE